MKYKDIGNYLIDKDDWFIIKKPNDKEPIFMSRLETIRYAKELLRGNNENLKA